MANIKDNIGVFDQTASQPLDLQKMMDIIGWHKGLMTADLIDGKNAEQMNHMWVEDTFLSVINAIASTQTTSQLTLVVGSGQGGNFIVNDYIKVESEVMKVTAVSTDTLTVTRAQRSTDTTLHTSTAVVYNLGQALADNASPPTANATTRSRVTNFVQTLLTTIDVGELAQAVEDLQGNEFQTQIVKQTPEHLMKIENNVIHGIGSAGSAGVGGAMKGLLAYITTNVTAVGGTLAFPAFDDLLVDCYVEGGHYPNAVYAGKTAMKAVSFWGNNKLSTYVTDTRYGMSKRVPTLNTAIGELSVHLNPMLPPGTMVILNKDMAKISWLQNKEHYGFTRYAKTKLGDSGVIQSHLTLELRNERGHAVLNGITGGA